MQVICPKCKKQGTLTSRLTISYGIRYHYYYVQHVEFIKGKRKTTWHYLGKYEDLPEDIKKLIHKDIHKDYTQNNEAQKTFKSKKESRNDIDCPGSIVRSSISGCRPLDPGSNPGQGAIKRVICFRESIMSTSKPKIMMMKVEAFS